MTGSDDFINNPWRISCHEAVELVTEFLDDALDRDDVVRFADHLAACEACRVYVDQIERTITLIRVAGTERVRTTPKDFDALVALLAERAAKDEHLG